MDNELNKDLLHQSSIKRVYVCQNCSQPIPGKFDSIFCEYCDLFLLMKEIELFQLFKKPGGFALGD